MTNKILVALAFVVLAGCGGVSVGVGYHSGDPWQMRPEIPRDPPPPDWLHDLERQYREAKLTDRVPPGTSQPLP